MRQSDGVTFLMIIKQITTIQWNNYLIHNGKDYLKNFIHFSNEQLRMDTHTTLGYLSKVKKLISIYIVIETLDDDLIHSTGLCLVISIQFNNLAISFHLLSFCVCVLSL